MRGSIVMLCTVLLALPACKRSESVESAAAAPAASGQERAEAAASKPATAEPLTAGAIDFPAIPQIVVPEIVGITPAQAALESGMQSLIDPIAGITVRPANCTTDGALINDGGITSVDAQGGVTRNGDEGIFSLTADGSGTANYGGGIITVQADGSGTINGSREGGGDDAIISVQADGSGTYNGQYGLISLDGKGAGTWNGDDRVGIISNHGDGSGTWNGPQGIITINADGSGTWNGPHGLIRNNGDDTGQVGTPSRTVAMAPIPKVAPAGRFPPLKKFAPPGAPCGFVITLNDQVLFDFDKSDIRPDAANVLDMLVAALRKVPDVKSLEIRGHTDAKGSDTYNIALSNRRAQSVMAALQQRGTAVQTTAKGYGESQPVAPNEQHDGQDNPAGRQLNRRVEILVRT